MNQDPELVCCGLIGALTMTVSQINRQTTEFRCSAGRLKREIAGEMAINAIKDARRHLNELELVLSREMKTPQATSA